MQSSQTSIDCSREHVAKRKHLQENVDLEKVKERLRLFDTCKFKTDLSAFAYDKCIAVTWVESMPIGGWEGNVRMRDADENGFDVNDTRLIEDIFADVIASTDHTTNVSLSIVCTSRPRGLCDQLLYYSFIRRTEEEKQHPEDTVRFFTENIPKPKYNELELFLKLPNEDLLASVSVVQKSVESPITFQFNCELLGPNVDGTAHLSTARLSTFEKLNGVEVNMIQLPIILRRLLALTTTAKLVLDAHFKDTIYEWKSVSKKDCDDIASIFGGNWSFSNFLKAHGMSIKK